MAFNPELGSTSPAVLLDNAERLDKLVNGPAADVPDRGGDPLYSWRQIMAVNQAKQEQLDDIITSLDTASFTFSDTTAGLAGTTDGQYFRVPQGEGDAVGFIYYKNSAGAAVVVASLASAEITKLLGKDDSQKLVAFTDDDGASALALDERGGIFTADSPEDIRKTIGKTGYDRAPAILKITSADKVVHGFMDEFGGVQLPGLQGSVQENIKRLNKRLSEHLERRRVLDARECGLDPFSSEDMWYPLQRATNWLGANGGGTIYIPEGAYRISRPVTPVAGVGYIGAGKKKARLLPFKATAPFLYRGNEAYIDNLLFTGFTIDGENQTLNPASGYLPEIKAIFIQYWSNSIIDDMEIVNIGATGLGVDMHYNCLITRCIVENCGRLAEQGALGASGIGIGTGFLNSEPLYVSQNLCRNNKNYGIFYEPQRGVGTAQDIITTDNVCLGNYAGIADCGVEGLIVSNNQMRGNTHGFLMYPGTNNGGKPGRRGRLQGNIIRGNTENGVTSVCSKTDPLLGEYALSGNHIYENGKDGINMNYSYPTVKNLNNVISNNEIYRNGRHGVSLESGDVVNLDIVYNRIYDNGQTTTGHAVNIQVPMSRSSVSNNKLRDTQSTPTQQYPVFATGALTDVDISFNHCVGNAQNTLSLTGAKTRVTTFINPGIDL
ncbi:right-handed parallel beta-helix repeat-containing protein [Klebsiella pneumoniae]|uniref:right-handed parallel beta-helix repeat-containing protein n=2 Tax=Klebsiella pneumoniae TaxID=573 RepID=UPI00103383F9|nr:right-handed parallel beta-helix repeat-containing protein [Klebsiella pneumoniae]MEA4763961.1 right-handed parallel beta-helix repeat-containing protein [Klebsiella pneumoniae]HBW8573930.1 right-handed parallel beta-helix repeat-containing protein [Klebsiella pneumoniae]HBW8645835.1 right-handed parallel beta-helix repeat-containing protein [Klebsiella pneumoniae]HBW8681701.1 right-handed parallel beta-helix repeat-containing protein [Klebsiella pneumoniae]HCF8535704.1 right-handed paralle